jgi:diaminohydroxyphosphoribosylaminopyrimidine deaminase/5-amino-6-(5-phosphoribosylamino)uracil reductase
MGPERFLRRAHELAERARGRTSPNPIVGSVIVRDGEVVGEGWHEGPGKPHAERMALAAAGDLARGADLYCTLEPCCHYGRTPPCTEGIIEAGIARVWFSVFDPDPQVAGRGAEQLRSAGLKVTSGVLAEEVAYQLRAYRRHRRMGLPWVTAKWAMTLDGKLAAESGDSRWVSGPAARRLVHELRDRVDAVLVGAGTVVADDPALTCRLDEFGPCERPVRQPLRVVVDTHGRTPPTAQVFTDGVAPTLLAVGETCPLTTRPGAELLRLPERDGRVDPTALMSALAARGVVEVLSESGGTLAGTLLREGLVNEVVAVIAPKLVGGAGPSPWDGPGQPAMADALELVHVETSLVGSDTIITGLIEDDC